MNRDKKDITPNTQLVQIKSESEGWKRTVNFMIDENIHLKAMLTQILKNAKNKNLLETAEEFHTNFLKQDHLIVLLRNDIAELDVLLENADKIDLNEIKKQSLKIRGNISNAAKGFDELKVSFNDQIMTNI